MIIGIESGITLQYPLRHSALTTLLRARKLALIESYILSLLKSTGLYPIMHHLSFDDDEPEYMNKCMYALV